MSNQSVYAVIMAGGRGERFWPMGRQKRPKQLLKFFSKTTLLESTVQRLFPYLLPENILILTHQAYVQEIQSLLPIPADNIIGEPVGRDTAPCIALATALIKRRIGPKNATLIFLPADHLISPVSTFQSALKRAVEEAKYPYIVTLGISPTFPATAYGYIHAKKFLKDQLFEVDCFCEKPDIATAKKFLESAAYYWNSGIFVWDTQTIYEAFKKEVPALFTFMKQVEETPDAMSYVKAHFHLLPKISIDYAIMEKTSNIRLMPATYTWNDIGTWDALQSLLPKDSNGNTCKGRQVTLACNDSIIINDSPTEFIGVIGVEKMCIIHADHATLICPISQLEKIKQLLCIINEKGEYHELT